MEVERHSAFQSFVISHPGISYSAAAGALTVFSLSPAPVLPPLILLLTVLRLSAWSFLSRQNGRSIAITQIVVVSVASAILYLAPSLDALSTHNTSLVVLSIISLFTSTLGITTIWAGCYATRFTQTPWAQLTVFPALWASVWGTVAHVSPVGQLATWSPVVALGPYAWIREYFGQWGINWITAAWAVILSEVVGNWLVDSGKPPTLIETESLLDGPSHIPSYQSVGVIADRSSVQDSAKPLSRSRSVLVLMGGLLLLMLPTYAFPYLPAPAISKDITTYSVSCALPSTPGRIPSLDDYIRETKTLQSSSELIIWPESAVKFDSPEHKFEAFAKIQYNLSHKKFVGVSFEEFVPELNGKRVDTRRNGFALLSNNSGPPALEYFKRNLVPVAESFSLTPGTEPPSIFTLELGPPKGVKAPTWAPAPNYTRPIPLSASICLDFASPSSFTDFESRPALILAPARTWHVGVGYAMWEQAQARARETGSTIVWCDGGEGGLGGIASRNYNEVIQVGGPSWTKKIGLQYPFNQHRTFFSAGGDSTALVLVWSVLGLGWVSDAFLLRYRREGAGQHASLIQRLGAIIRTWRGHPNPSEETSLLHA